jgi:hypothetical protein
VGQEPELDWKPRQSPGLVLGWRLWRLRDGRLGSWAVSYDWTPGTNTASCRLPATVRCTSSPGRHCQCGFWCLNSLLDCLARGRYNGIGWWPVLGLVRGWGAVALHGKEGFRAEHAAVVCLFSDWPFLSSGVRPGGGESSRWLRMVSLLLHGDSGPPPANQRDRAAALRDAAGNYGVPLVSIAESVRVGLLQELDVGPSALDEVQAWLAIRT